VQSGTASAVENLGPQCESYSGLGIASASSKAHIACGKTSDASKLAVWSWNGSAWGSTVAGSASGDEVDALEMQGDRVAWVSWHTAFNTPGFATFNYAELSGSTWTNHAIEEFEQNAPPISLVVQQGVPYVFFSEYTYSGGTISSDLRQGFRDASGWTAQSAGAPDTLNFRNIARLDPQGKIAVVWTTYEDPPRLAYATEAAGWAEESITTDTTYSYAFAIDAAGVPHVAWVAPTGVKLASRIAGRWFEETVNGHDVDAVAMALSSSGAPVVASGGDGADGGHHAVYLDR